VRAKGTLGAAAAAILLLAGAFGTVFLPATHVFASGPQALILGATVINAPSVEESDLESQGWTVTVADDATWDAMSASQFAAYQLLVFGDPACGSSDSIQAAAVSDESTWAPLINGNVIVIGTDPVFHYIYGGEPGAGVLISHALAYAGAQTGKTGAYVDLSCYYENGGTNAEDSPLLDGLEAGFTMYSENNCSATIHVVASAQQLIGITDADLSNWGCSVHEYFGTWPADFVPYAIDTAASDTPPSGICPNPPYQPPDGSTPGCPYIVGRGGGLTAGSIGLAGPPGYAAVNTSQTLTVSVEVGGSPVVGAVVTLDDVSGPNAGATATVTTDGSGAATYAYTSAVAGTDEWTASFTPAGGGLETSDPAAVVWKLAAPFTATATPSSVVFGTSSTLADIGLPGPATGSVSFDSGATNLCVATLPATTCATSTSLGALVYPITATYSGDATYADSTATTALTVTQATTSFTASATPASVAFGTQSALAEAGLPSGATGAVTFTSGATTLCTAPLPATSCATSTTLPVGSYPITATYPGDTNYSGSTASTALVVTVATTSFTASATPASVPFGTHSTLAEAGLPAPATGTVTFSSGASTLCVATRPATSCLTSTSLAGGSYPITATYSGDGNLTGSSATTQLTVTPVATTFTASATASSVPFGTMSTLRATGLPGSATGTVTFASGATPLCAAVLPATTCMTSTGLGAATYAITATYSGDVSHTGSTATTSLTVTPLTTAFTAGATPPSVTFGAPSLLEATGLPVGATGTVTFTWGGTTLCVATLQTTFCTMSTALASGSYPITATYSGDENFIGSTATTSLTVTPAVTTTTVVSSQDPGVPNQQISYAATVVSNPGSGTVTFTDGGVPIVDCTGLPIDPFTGIAVCSTTYASTGTHIIAASFNGNADFLTSTSPQSGVLALTETIDAPVVVPTTGAGNATDLGRALVGGGVLVLLGLLGFTARRRRRETR
jgi:hypothetical protein